MGRPRKYTKAGLEKKINKYFKRITREITVKEPVDTGEVDRYGHPICKMEPVVNSLGKELREISYIVPPTIGDLCLFLGISSSTWAEYCDQEKHPEFSEATTQARGRIRAYLQRELLTRSGRDVKGIIFDLQNNHGYREKVELDSQEQKLKIEKLQAEVERLRNGNDGKKTVTVELEPEVEEFGN